MALDNATVLENLKSQLKEVTGQLNSLNETRVKLLGAIDVLEQIEESKVKPEVVETKKKSYRKLLRFLSLVLHPSVSLILLGVPWSS